MNTTRAFLVAATIGGWTSPALAQTETLGFPIGEKSRIHTNLDLGVAFDSNPSRYDRASPDARSDWRGLVRPSLVVNVPGSSLSLFLRSQLTINQYFGVDQASDTTFGGNVGLGLTAGSDRSAVAFSVENSLVRTPTVLDEPGTVASDERRFKEWNNRGQAKLSLRPGGRALEFNLGYTNWMSFYDDLPWSMQHGGLLEARWRFFPKTVAFFAGTFSVFDAERTPGGLTLRSCPYSAQVGLTSAITARFSAHLAAGIGDTLTWVGRYFSDVSPFNSRTIIGSARATYLFTDTMSLSLGYERRVSPIILLQSYTGDAVNLTSTLGITPRLQFRLFGQYEYRGYAGVNGRGVHAITGDARVEYWFFDFLNGALAYRVLAQNPKDPPAGASATPFLEDFTRHQVMLNVGLRY